MQEQLQTRWFWQPSPWLHALHTLILWLALTALQLSALPDALYLSLHLVCLLYAVQLLLQLRWLAAGKAVSGLRYLDSEQWQAYSVHAGWRDINVLGNSIVLPGLLVLYYQFSGSWRRRGLVITGFELPEQAQRSLRVRLRFAPAIGLQQA